MYQTTPAEKFRHRVSAGLLGGTIVMLAWAAFPGFPVSSGPSADPETVERGRMLFVHEWSAGDALASAGGDGLGPVFNARSCVHCHSQGGLGGAGTAQNVVNSFLVHPTKRDPQVRGGAVHAFAVEPAYRETFDTVRELYPIVPGGVRVVNGCTMQISDFDPVRFQPIDTPALFGAGWIDLIPGPMVSRARTARGLANMTREFELDFSQAPTGRVRTLADGRIGKFGWKAQFATLEEFVADACANEIGLSTPGRRQATPLGGQPVAETAGSDLNDEQFQAMVSFVAMLPRPEQSLPDDPHERARASRGEQVFESVGCAACHRPNVAGVEGVYSDFLLYSLAERTAGTYGPGTIPDAPWPGESPQPDEWKTPPLWGVADSAPYFHDGKSPTLEAAIKRHGGAAEPVRKNYENQRETDRQALIVFLETLRAPKSALPVPEAEAAFSGVRLTSR